MAAPSKVYVATTSLGVYYTSNFDDPGADPTWAAVNDGLVSTAAVCLQLDPFDKEARQYLVSGGAVYRRENGGPWESLLTTAEARVLTGKEIGRPVWVWCDPTIDGTVLVLVSDEQLVDWRVHHYVLISADYGDNWVSWAVDGDTNYHYTDGGLAAFGDTIYVTASTYAGAGATLFQSANGGDTWAARLSVGGGGLVGTTVDVNISVPTDVYILGSYGGGASLYRIRGGVATRLIATDLIAQRGGALWSDPDDTDHMRYVDAEHIYVTYDDWGTYSTLDYASAYLALFAPIADLSNPDLMIVGRKPVGDPSSRSLVGIIQDEVGGAYSQRSGNNYNTPPYTNAIPVNAGQIAHLGIQAIPFAPTEGPTPPPGSTITPPGGSPIALGGAAYVQAVTFPDYLGYEIGEPMPGDRGVFRTDTQAHASLHAEDIRRNIDDGDPTLYHLPEGTVGQAPVHDGTGYIPTDIATQAELNAHAADPAAHHDPVTLGAGSDAALALVGQELTLADVLTPTEHTAIGDSAPHHAAVTLGAGNDPALALLGQELTLTMPEPPGTTYRQFTYVDNGDSTWSFVTNSDGMPVFAQLDTE